MTSNKLISLIRQLKPTPVAMDDDLLMNWINEVEGLLLVQVHLLSPQSVTPLSEPSDDELTAVYPFDRLYLQYLKAMIDYANGEYDRYNNSIGLFNTYLGEYQRYIGTVLHPSDGAAGWKGYYLSAYSIAVQHGYEGTEAEWLKSLKGDTGETGPQGATGTTGETSLPVARGESADGVAYAATDAGSGSVLPEVSTANSYEQISAVGKGRQIVFVPNEKNLSTAPTLQLNGGETIPIRMRAPQNQGTSNSAPDATLPVPAGALMRGVPYTLTFCGKYWLIDSQIQQFKQTDADMLRRYADKLLGLSDGGSIAAPIVNAADGISDELATMFVQRSIQENAEPPESGDVAVPTVGRVAEILCTDASEDYAASGADSVQDWATMGKGDGSGMYRVAQGQYRINGEYGDFNNVTVMDSQDGSFRFVWVWLYNEEFAYAELYLTLGPDDTPLRQLYFSTEECMLEIFGQNNLLLPPYDVGHAAKGDVLTIGEYGHPIWAEKQPPHIVISLSFDTEPGVITGATKDGKAIPLTNAAGGADYSALLDAINDAAPKGGTVELKFGGISYGASVQRRSGDVLITYLDLMDPFDPDVGFTLIRANINKDSAIIEYREV